MNELYKTQGKIGLFDNQFAKQQLNDMGNPLEAVKKVVDFEMFRSLLEDKLLNTNKKNNAGAKPFDVVLMFKIMFIQRYYNLSDNQVEYQIIDRLSFKSFLGLETGDKVPDEKTIWAFREKLTEMGLVEDLFELFGQHLKEKGLYSMRVKYWMPVLQRFHVNAIPVKRISRLKKITGTNYGTISPARKAIRTLIPVGHKRTNKTFMDIRIKWKSV